MRGIEEDGAGCALVIVEVRAPESVGVAVAYVDVVPLVRVQVRGRHREDLGGTRRGGVEILAQQAMKERSANAMKVRTSKPVAGPVRFDLSLEFSP